MAAKVSVLMIGLLCCLGCVGAGGNQAQRDLARELAERRKRRTQSLRLYRQGIAAQRDGKLKDAIEHLQRAVEVDDRNARAWMQLGLAAYERKEYYVAAKAFFRAGRLEPARFEPRYNLGIVFETLGQYVRAIEQYEAALNQAPGQLEVMENLARCYLRTNTKRDEAYQLIVKARRLESRAEWLEWLDREAERLEKENEHAATTTTMPFME